MLPTGAKGTYALLFEPDQPLEIRVGRLGEFTLPAGKLIYVGSALGPGGLAARLRRHLRPDKTLHWHIDYLTAILTPTVWRIDASGERRECAWVRELLALPGAGVPIPGFGSSDCREGCPAHLVWLGVDRETGKPVDRERAGRADPADFLAILGKAGSDAALPGDELPVA